MKKSLLIVFLCAVSAQATVWVSDGSRLDVQNKINGSADGDTITMPTGTFSDWTQSVNIDGSKSITLSGNTTVDPVAKTANDLTIIQDNITNTNTPVLYLNSNTTKSPRVTGITFTDGARGTLGNLGAVDIGAEIHGVKARLDHCHFLNLNRLQAIYVGGAVFGCIDHNLIETTNISSQSILVRMASWNGDTNGTGDKSFADYPWLGTNKFIFIEDNCFNNTYASNPLANVIDADFGSRMVIRYNHFYDTQVHNHGTENRYRGARSGEVYGNDFHFTTVVSLGLVRTGVYLFHDNTFAGTQGTGLDLNYFRFAVNFGPPPSVGGASGDNVWDVNATQADGTHVDGNAPYLFDSGTATGGSTTTIVDTTKSWTTNQWARYTAKRVSDEAISMILSNTGNTLTVTAFSGGYNNNSPPVWANGNSYQIRKVLIALDQPGRGKSDLIQGGYNQGGATLNTVTNTGTVHAYVNNSTLGAWPHQALEPCYSWNNLYGAVSLGFSVINAYDQLVSGQDYYNDSSSAAVVSKYVAALNGVDYLGPYTYPHPLNVADIVSTGSRKIGRDVKASLGGRAP